DGVSVRGTEPRRDEHVGARTRREAATTSEVRPARGLERFADARGRVYCRASQGGALQVALARPFLEALPACVRNFSGVARLALLPKSSGGRPAVQELDAWLPEHVYDRGPEPGTGPRA